MNADSPGAADDDFLARMAGLSRHRLEQAESVCSLAELQQRAEVAPAPPGLVLSSDGFDLIAEIKKRSPSQGQLATQALSPAAQAAHYTRGGAAALSVLTEPDEFHGSLDDLAAVAAVDKSMPAMRKDFLVSPYQVAEARVAGAAGVLLIAAIVDRNCMQEMIDCAQGLGMFVLMEVFDQRDLEHCLPVIETAGRAGGDPPCQTLIGVNCRDLRTLQVDFDRFESLAPELPAGFPWVAESGVSTAADAKHVTDLGYRLALVGSALMRSDDPAGLVKAMIAAGR